MSEPKVTPGEWEAHSYEVRAAIPNSFGWRVVATFNDPADGPVLAASKDLYTAGRAFLKEWDEQEWDVDRLESATRMMRAALAKAEGRG